tara:strand:- start:646 stop:861 length:216 start_codon:yes stop_codon:yes gene_type:complete
MSEFSRKPKFKVGDLVSVMMPGFKNCGPLLGIIVEARPSTIQRLPMYWVHLPNGKRCNSVEEHLEFANARS